jgi:uncharacterized membrane protein
MMYGENSSAYDLSNDGSIIVGWNAGQGGQPDRTPFYWDLAPHFMGALDSTWDGGECYGISPDGNIFVGTSANFAFRYTIADGMEMIVDPSVWPFGSVSLDVSNNDVIVGHADLGAFDFRAFIRKSGWSDIVLLKDCLQDSLGVTGLTD